ncbi:MFS transporter [Colwellia sp. MB02u-9]|uniref:MFS transporter n=1 Tax=Colwellia sp. MB02u-9 TaxID=2759823 RepID=UPI0015F5B490|nr:MFS transporter [Colwellia sp. MB02u-9]MBA6297785.1 MFS transporter [Colwellia sp. MB02u-9]
MRIEKSSYYLLSGALFCFFLTWSFSFSLFSIWLKQVISLSGEQIGMVFSINAVAALLVMPFYGLIQDKLGLKKQLLYVIAVTLILMGPFFVYIYAPLLTSNFYLAASLGGLVFAIAFSAGIGVLETYIERAGRAVGFEFGKARMWGSLGWALATFFSGSLLNLNPNYNFWLSSLCGAAFLILIVFVNTQSLVKVHDEFNGVSTAPKLHDIVGLFKLPQFWQFIVFVLGVTCIYSVYDQQFPIYFSSLFPTEEEGNVTYGYLNSFQVFLEAGGMFVAPFIVNKIGAKNGLILSGAIMAIRMIGSGFADDVIFISAMKLLHAVELPILLVAIFKYIAINFDKRLSSSIYLVGFLVFSQVGASILSVGIGTLYDNIGFAASYKILGSIVAIFTFISIFILKNSSEKHQSIELVEETAC